MKAEKYILVFVTDQFSCERLIVAGRKLSDQLMCELKVINLTSPSKEQNPMAIEFLFKTSKENDAVMLVEYTDDFEKRMIGIIKDEAPAAVITGMPYSSDSFLHNIWRKFNTVDFYIVDADGKFAPVSTQLKFARKAE